MLSLIHAVSSEWLKRRRSLTTWLVVGSATFVPAVLLAASLRHPGNLAIYLVGVLPVWLLPGLEVTVVTFPARAQLTRAAVFLVDVLPVVGIQYLLALRLRTFVAPLAMGMALWILSLGLISWQYSYLLPYTYPSLDFLSVEYHRKLPTPAALSTIAASVFLAATAAGALVFSLGKDKG